jgi:hypothetical protein
MHVPVFYDLTQTMVYNLEIGIINDKSEERLLTFDQNGNLRSHNFIDKVRLISIENLPEKVVDFSGSDRIQLVESAIAPSTLKSGDTAAVTMRWAASEPLTKDYQIFIHLLDENENIVMQADGPPAAGWYPTSWWPVGEIITDQRDIVLPDNLPSGSYRLISGFYDLDTLERVAGPVLLGTIHIEP